jgi:hypothetical protein
MKNLIGILTLILTISVISSCGSSPYKKRKGCKGNGSFSGHRNLGVIDNVQKQTNDTYAWTSEQVESERM